MNAAAIRRTWLAVITQCVWDFVGGDAEARHWLFFDRETAETAFLAAGINREKFCSSLARITRGNTSRAAEVAGVKAVA